MGGIGQPWAGRARRLEAPPEQIWDDRQVAPAVRGDRSEAPDRGPADAVPAHAPAGNGDSARPPSAAVRSKDSWTPAGHAGDPAAVLAERGIVVRRRHAIGGG